MKKKIFINIRILMSSLNNLLRNAKRLKEEQEALDTQLKNAIATNLQRNIRKKIATNVVKKEKIKLLKKKLVNKLQVKGSDIRLQKMIDAKKILEDKRKNNPVYLDIQKKSFKDCQYDKKIKDISNNIEKKNLKIKTLNTNKDKIYKSFDILKKNITKEHNYLIKTEDDVNKSFSKSIDKIDKQLEDLKENIILDESSKKIVLKKCEELTKQRFKDYLNKIYKEKKEDTYLNLFLNEFLK